MEYNRRRPTTFWLSWDSNSQPLTQYFPFHQISRERALKIQALIGFKPMTKYYSAFEISKENAYEMLKARANGM